MLFIVKLGAMNLQIDCSDCRMEMDISAGTDNDHESYTYFPCAKHLRPFQEMTGLRVDVLARPKHRKRRRDK